MYKSFLILSNRWWGVECDGTHADKMNSIQSLGGTTGKTETSILRPRVPTD